MLQCRVVLPFTFPPPAREFTWMLFLFPPPPPLPLLVTHGKCDLCDHLGEEKIVVRTEIC